MNNYPATLTDPTRVGIAAMLVEKEFLKLFPSLEPEIIKTKIRQDIDK